MIAKPFARPVYYSFKFSGGKDQEVSIQECLVEKPFFVSAVPGQMERTFVAAFILMFDAALVGCTPSRVRTGAVVLCSIVWPNYFV